MDIDHLHFYVDDGVIWQRWFIQRCGGCLLSSWQDQQVQRSLLTLGQVPILLSAPLTSAAGAVSQYLVRHPNGIADVAFRVNNLEQQLEHILAQGGQLCQPLQVVNHPQGSFKWCQIRGWAGLRHTLIERHGPWYLLPWLPPLPAFDLSLSGPLGAIATIDHAVLNVPKGDLERAAAWYETVLGFQRQQQFVIKTARSGLQSYVLRHPEGQAQIPINEPGTPNSQIQEFLTHHRGAGIQHVALQTTDVVSTVARLRQLGLAFLSVPDTYYDDLVQRPEWGLIDADLAALKAQQILLDWSPTQPQGCLLQTFTQPIFGQPTCFFELIERRQFWQSNRLQQAQGFGEGNFQALFEAIEREQLRRGSLQPSEESC